MNMIEIEYRQNIDRLNLSFDRPQIGLVLKGTGTAEVYGKVYACPSNTIMIFNARDSALLSNIELMVFLSPNWTFAQSLGQFRYEQPHLEAENPITNRFRSLISNVIRDHAYPDCDPYQKTCSEMALLSFMRQHYAHFQESQVELRQKVHAWIVSHSETECSLAEAADYFGFSSAYFSRWFKQNFDLPFLKYLNRIRVEKAVSLLKTENGNLLRTALNAGFPNLNAFNREFERYYHCSPSEYRSQIQREDAGLSPNTVLNLLDLHPGGQTNTLEITAQITENRHTFDSRFLNSFIPLGTVSVLSANLNLPQIQQILQSFDVRIVQIDLDQPANSASQFSKEQRIFDTLIDLGISPILTLDFRQYHGEDFFFYFSRFLHFFINRYGSTYLNTWFFEAAYESTFDDTQAQAYCQWVGKLRRLLQECNLSCSLWGPRLLPDRACANLARLLENKPALDGISIRSAPFSLEKENGLWTVVRNTSPDYISFQYQNALNRAKKAGYDQVWISRWRDQYFPRSPLNDDACRAARVCEVLLNNYQKIPALPAPPLADVLVEENDETFSGLEGLVARHEIAKPIRWLYSFWKHTDQYLLYYDDHILITYDDENFLQIICHNARELLWTEFLEHSTAAWPDIASCFADQEKLHVKITLKGNLARRYIMKTRILNETTANPYGAWRKMEAPDSFLGKSEILYLKGISQPAIENQILESKDGQLVLDFEMEWNEVRHIHLLRYFEQPDFSSASFPS